jgi:hypothetical protein
MSLSMAGRTREMQKLFHKPRHKFEDQVEEHEMPNSLTKKTYKFEDHLEV